MSTVRVGVPTPTTGPPPSRIAPACSLLSHLCPLEGPAWRLVHRLDCLVLNLNFLMELTLCKLLDLSGLSLSLCKMGIKQCEFIEV